MTPQQVTALFQDLGVVRQALGDALARLQGMEPRLAEISRVLDRLTVLEKSVDRCQSDCGRERTGRQRVAHWILYVVAAAIPGCLIWYLQSHLGH